MFDRQKFIDGYLQGWQSIAGPRLHFPDIEPPLSYPAGSPFIHGLLKGIAAAKREMAAVAAAKREPADLSVSAAP